MDIRNPPKGWSKPPAQTDAAKAAEIEPEPTPSQSSMAPPSATGTIVLTPKSPEPKRPDHDSFDLLMADYKGFRGTMDEQTRRHFASRRDAQQLDLNEQLAKEKSEAVRATLLQKQAQLGAMVLSEGEAPHIRYVQAKYMTQALRQTSSFQSHLNLVWSGLSNEAEKALISNDSERQKLLTDEMAKLIFAVPSETPYIKTAQEEMTAHPELYGSFGPNSDDLAVAIFGNLTFRAQGLTPLKTQAFKNQEVKEITRYLESLTAAKSVVKINVPRHSMLLTTDPEKTTYRVYDPNAGLYRFHDPALFAQASAHLMQDYNDSVFPILGGAKTTSKALSAANLEVPISQELDTQGAPEGVCMALTAHVAKWLLSHPDFNGALNSKILGLSDFDITTNLLPLGQRLLDQGNFRQAARVFDQILSISTDPRIDETKRTSRESGLNEALTSIQAQLQQASADPVLLALRGRLEATVALQRIPAADTKTASPKTKPTPKDQVLISFTHLGLSRR